jgi:hypothetical protein
VEDDEAAGDRGIGEEDRRQKTEDRRQKTEAGSKNARVRLKPDATKHNGRGECHHSAAPVVSTSL